MPDSVQDPEPAAGLPVATDGEVPLHRFQWLGVLIVIAFGVAPDIRNAFLGWEGQPIEIMMSISEIMVAILIRSIKVSFVVCIVMVVSKTRWESIGFVRPRWQDMPWSVGIWLAGSLAYYVVVICMSLAGFRSVDVFESVEPPLGWSDLMLILVGSLANGFAEEAVIRGYLLTRFERLLSSTWAAVIISTLLFASYHIYQGIVPMAGIFALGFVYAGAFCYLRRIWPIILAHAFADITGLLALFLEY